MAAPARQLSDANVGGTGLGQSTTDLISFYGVTPIVQPAAAAQAAITDGSTGVANPTTGVAALTGSYNSTLIITALATIIAAVNAHRTALVNLGLEKGSA